MGLSASGNAHGEEASVGTSSHVLCCNFAGSLTCDGQNKVLGLSSSTNAHAEAPDQTTYTTDICYSDLSCINTALDCVNTEFPLSVVSLSNYTNAHIGGINDYNINICCSSANFVVTSVDIYWSDDGTNEISTIDVVTGTTVVKLVLKNSGLSQGTIVSFDIWEDDLFLDDFIKSINGTVDSNGSAMVDWIPTIEDLEKTPNDYDEFLFQVNDQASSYLILNLLEISECVNTVLCGDYSDATTCGSDTCQVSQISAPSNLDCNDPTKNCFCSWVVDECNFQFDLIEASSETVIGYCIFDEGTSDDCSDGLLSYSWTTSWTGSAEDKPIECSDGTRIIECPAQLQLPFFSVYNIIFAAIIIALIYLIIILRKKKHN